MAPIAQRRTIWTVLTVLLLLLAAAGAAMPSAAQEESTPTAEDEAQADDQAAEDDTSDEELPPPQEEGEIVASTQQVIAQGLAIYDEFDEGKWWLTEIDVPSAARASSIEAPGFGFIFAVEGSTIVRNDLTGKRARIEPGEAYYVSIGDPYTWYTDGNSTAWFLEIVPSDREESESIGDVRYESDPFEELPGDVRDFEMTAGVVPPGGSVDASGGGAPTLVLLLTSSLQTSDGPVLRAPAPYTVAGDTTLTNDTEEDAQYYLLTLGTESIDGEAPPDADVADDEETTDADGDGTPEAEADTSDAEVDTSDIDPDLDSDQDDLPDVVEIEIGSDPNNIDTDGDGLYDAEEVGYTAILVPDSDGDGYNDGDEVLVYGTDPNDPNSYPE